PMARWHSTLIPIAAHGLARRAGRLAIAFRPRDPPTPEIMRDYGEMTRRALASLLGELGDGPSGDASFILNAGDPGLLRSLDKLSAAEASAVPAGGGATIAAHVDHIRYGLELMNRWSQGENPFSDADWAASWERTRVTEEEWHTLRARLRDELRRWG